METAEDEKHEKVGIYTVPWEWWVVAIMEASCVWRMTGKVKQGQAMKNWNPVLEELGFMEWEVRAFKVVAWFYLQLES